LQTIQQLEARALRRADTVDELDRLLYGAKGKLRSEKLRDDAGLWVALKRLFLPNRLEVRVKKLERDLARARAALRIAVVDLHQGHCQQLRSAPWSGSLIAPSEAELRDANDEYHPWNRVQRAGKHALRALNRINRPDDPDLVDAAFTLLDEWDDGPVLFSSDHINRKIEVMNLAGTTLRNFANTTRLLTRERPEAGIAADPFLDKFADKLSGVRTRFGVMIAQRGIDDATRRVAALMGATARVSGKEMVEVEAAQDRLEEVNHQIALAAWSNIPARLRPPGR
jgi:hypothetical protein